MTESLFRWGILGPGKIAKKFASAIQGLPGHEIIAVGSRTLNRAQEFATEFAAQHVYGSYEELVADDSVDAIYIATPHTYHCENSLLCLANHRPVLCEKPFAINAREVETIVEAARRSNTFLMEAMWTRFFPLMTDLKDLIMRGEIGEPRLLLANFGFRSDFDPSSRLFDRSLGGGSLLDVGIYPLSLGSFLFGTPLKTAGVAEIGATGVDEQAAFSLLYANGVIGAFTSAVRTQTPLEATLIGTSGKVTISAPFWIPTSITLSVNGQEPVVITKPPLVNGYEYEALEVAKRVGAEELESPIMPWSESIEIVRTMDSLRSQFGIQYKADTI